MALGFTAINAPRAPQIPDTVQYSTPAPDDAASSPTSASTGKRKSSVTAANVDGLASGQGSSAPKKRRAGKAPHFEQQIASLTLDTVDAEPAPGNADTPLEEDSPSATPRVYLNPEDGEQAGLGTPQPPSSTSVASTPNLILLQEPILSNHHGLESQASSQDGSGGTAGQEDTVQACEGRLLREIRTLTERLGRRDATICDQGAIIQESDEVIQAQDDTIAIWQENEQFLVADLLQGEQDNMELEARLERRNRTIDHMQQQALASNVQSQRDPQVLNGLNQQQLRALVLSAWVDTDQAQQRAANHLNALMD